MRSQVRNAWEIFLSLNCDDDRQFTGALANRIEIDDDASQVRLYHGTSGRHVATYAFKRPAPLRGASQALRYPLTLLWSQIQPPEPAPEPEPEPKPPKQRRRRRPGPPIKFDRGEVERALKKRGSINGAARQLDVAYSSLRTYIERAGLPLPARS